MTPTQGDDGARDDAALDPKPTTTSPHPIASPAFAFRASAGLGAVQLAPGHLPARLLVAANDPIEAAG